MGGCFLFSVFNISYPEFFFKDLLKNPLKKKCIYFLKIHITAITFTINEINNALIKKFLSFARSCNNSVAMPYCLSSFFIVIPPVNLFIHNCTGVCIMNQYHVFVTKLSRYRHFKNKKHENENHIFSNLNL